MPVVWLDRARNKIHNRTLIPGFDRELEVAFGNSPQAQVTVCDVFEGYRVDEAQRLVLGVQVSCQGRFGSHVVKLGNAQKVKRDYEGWERCMLRHGVASRIMMAVTGRALPSDRYAAVYQNAYQLFGTDSDLESPKTFELAVEWAINDNNPDCLSVERTALEVFNELNRCLYHDARESPQQAARFYRDELGKAASLSAWARWQESPKYRQLRRDALWLITARDKADAEQLPKYLDPFDFVAWALETSQLPSTLIGRSHGDLHGRNVLVGVSRGEVFQPAIFDYGDMTNANVVVWDFVKLECELKCRILPKLFHSPGARESLAQAAPQVRPPIAGTLRLPVTELDAARRADRLEFAFQFETALSTLTREIVSCDLASRARDAEHRHPTGNPILDRALCLFLRMRQEAAYWLGFKMSRAAQWRDEYNFALTVYGLLTAKWPVEAPHLEWALMSAGVAASQLDYEVSPHRTTRVALGELRQNAPATYPTERLPSHVIPLAWAHRMWKDKRYSEACDLLATATERFPQAVSLLQEHALCLAANGDLLTAKKQIEELRPLCRSFRDFETLCRLGRILKDSGDDAWKIDRPSFRKFVADNHSGCQLYKDAKRIYLEAFQFSRNYYPGINAATLALLTGDSDAKPLAEEVLEICPKLSVYDFEERYWIYATEGEACLVSGQNKKAAGFYTSALTSPCAKNIGMLQPLYDQLCRLHWAMGNAAVRPILKTMGDLGLLAALNPGPFENCGRS